LSVCAGGAVSNAPATDAARRIIDYSPYANIRGRTLARAPVAACLSSGFGPRSSGRNHEGIDLYTGRPEPIYAGGEGVIEFKGEYGGYGETLVIRHGAGVKTRYAHLSSYAPGARKGAIVRAGELIGATGATGNATAVHLHYEIIIDGAPVNPLTVAESVPAAYY
jgi:murein DD-endopeptidase MepM/ murein hydrolase activator NlpD